MVSFSFYKNLNAFLFDIYLIFTMAKIAVTSLVIFRIYLVFLIKIIFSFLYFIFAFFFLIVILINHVSLCFHLCCKLDMFLFYLLGLNLSWILLFFWIWNLIIHFKLLIHKLLHLKLLSFLHLCYNGNCKYL